MSLKQCWFSIWIIRMVDIEISMLNQCWITVTIAMKPNVENSDIEITLNYSWPGKMIEKSLNYSWPGKMIEKSLIYSWPGDHHVLDQRFCTAHLISESISGKHIYLHLSNLWMLNCTQLMFVKCSTIVYLHSAALYAVIRMLSELLPLIYKLIY